MWNSPVNVYSDNSYQTLLCSQCYGHDHFLEHCVFRFFLGIDILLNCLVCELFRWCRSEGGFECCPDKSFCPVVSYGDERDAPKTYYFRYIVKYVDQPTEAATPDSNAPQVYQGANYILDVSLTKTKMQSRESGCLQALLLYEGYLRCW